VDFTRASRVLGNYVDTADTVQPYDHRHKTSDASSSIL
jgi:hypothetical protein